MQQIRNDCTTINAFLALKTALARRKSFLYSGRINLFLCSKNIIASNKVYHFYTNICYLCSKKVAADIILVIDSVGSIDWDQIYVQKMVLDFSSLLSSS